MKCSLVQALRLCTEHTDHRVSRGINLLFLHHGTRRGEGSASRPGRSLPPEKFRCPLYRRLGGPQGRSGHYTDVANQKCTLVYRISVSIPQIKRMEHTQDQDMCLGQQRDLPTIGWTVFKPQQRFHNYIQIATSSPSSPFIKEGLKGLSVGKLVIAGIIYSSLNCYLFYMSVVIVIWKHILKKIT